MFCSTENATLDQKRVDLDDALDAKANIYTYKSICAKREPLAINSVENPNRSSENARCACSGARSAKPRPFSGKCIEHAYRWAEIQPKKNIGNTKIVTVR